MGQSHNSSETYRCFSLLWGLTRAKCIDVYSLILPELKDIGFFFVCVFYSSPANLQILIVQVRILILLKIKACIKFCVNGTKKKVNN